MATLRPTASTAPSALLAPTLVSWRTSTPEEEVMSGLRRTIRMIAVQSPWGVGGAQLALNEFMRFKAKQGAWGMEHVIAHFDNMPAYSCWQMYGSQLPHLQWFATRILAMVIGAGAPERFFSKLKWLKSPLRNCLSHAKTTKLLRMHYNLKLLARAKTRSGLALEAPAQHLGAVLAARPPHRDCGGGV